MTDPGACGHRVESPPCHLAPSCTQTHAVALSNRWRCSSRARCATPTRPQMRRPALSATIGQLVRPRRLADRARAAHSTCHPFRPPLCCPGCRRSGRSIQARRLDVSRRLQPCGGRPTHALLLAHRGHMEWHVCLHDMWCRLVLQRWRCQYARAMPGWRLVALRQHDTERRDVQRQLLGWVLLSGWLTEPHSGA